jgi:hypothetical protein
MSGCLWILFVGAAIKRRRQGIFVQLVIPVRYELNLGFIL